MGNKKEQLKYYFDFLWTMTEKEIKVRYKKTLFGLSWVILNPLFQMIVIGFIFQYFINLKMDNYFLYLFTGLLPWNFFALTLTSCTPLFVKERSLIQKSKFPRESLLFSVVLSNLFHFLVSLFLLIVILIGFKISVEGSLSHFFLLRMLLLLPLSIWLMVFTTGLVLLTSVLNVKYRDVNFIVQFILPLWFYASPIIYPLDFLPLSVQKVIFLNPLTGIIEGFHFSLLGNKFVNGYYLIYGLIMSLIIVTFGWYLFKKENPYFDDLL